MTTTAPPPPVEAAGPEVRPYPVRVEAMLDQPVSRWLWLVKWLLIVPHVLVLIPLWIASALCTVAALVAIVVTGRYPRGLFDFNVGVLRWSWRVGYYSYRALGTDRYPPFTLADRPDYPARLDVEYPQQLSRGLVLVKWLLAIPHYIILGILFGGGAWLTWRAGSEAWAWGTPGLVGVLVLVAGVILLFSGNYPRPLFDFIMGLNRWAQRVAGYSALMTDRYPPFRLDLGGSEPHDPAALPAATPTAAHAAGPTRRNGRWTGVRIVSVVVGALLTLGAASLLAVGAAGLWADRSYRDAAGYLTTGTVGIHSTGYAVAAENIDFPAAGPSSMYPAALLDRVQIRATSTDAATPVFIGIGPADEVAGYLAASPYDIVTDFSSGAVDYRAHPGTAAATPPTDTSIWTAQVSGPGTQTLTWPVANGDWTIVVMNADASPSVSATTTVGATVPWLRPVAIGVLAGGLIFLAAGVTLIAVPISRASRSTAPQPDAAPVP